jgi:hypothetical protein
LIRGPFGAKILCIHKRFEVSGVINALRKKVKRWSIKCTLTGVLHLLTKAYKVIGLK